MDAILVQLSSNYLHYNVSEKEPQLGQYYIADWAARQGFEVRIKHYESALPVVKDLTKLLESHACKVVGFYVDSENIWALRRIIPEIKHLLPIIKIVIGGPQVTGDPELALKRVISADVAIIGEGEVPFSKLLSCNFTYDELNTINGIVFKQGDKYINTGNTDREINIDQYSYPKRELYSLDSGLSYKSLITGRGCVGKCAFCFEGSKTHNRLRFRSIDSVKEEFSYLVELSGSNSYISFLDDTFIIDPERTINICNWLIQKYQGNVKWFCEARADILLKNKHLIPLMKKAGLIRVQLGGESGCQSILDAYKKGVTTRQIEEVVSLLYEVGIPSVYINFIIGGAFETVDTFNQTLNFAISLMNKAPGCVEVGSSLFTPYVGSPMRMHPDSYGIKIIDSESVRGQDGHIPAVETNELSEYKILQMKTYFDNEIDKQYDILLKILPKEVIMLHYKLDLDYNATTMWYQRINANEKYKNYFGAICSNKYSPFSEVCPNMKDVSIPHRTLQPISDGASYYYKSNSNEYVCFPPLEEKVFMLSAGKLSYGEIREILLTHGLLDPNKADNFLDDFYSKFDNEYYFVWKTLF